MPTIIIHNNISIDEFYDQIVQSSNLRFHNYQTNFQEYPISEKEYGDMETYSTYGEHSSDQMHLNGIHIERLIA